MAKAHTPGPWVVAYSVGGITVDSGRPVRFNLTAAGTAVICNVFPHADAEHFNGEANARLIAAAPELLAFVAEYIEAWKDGMAGDSYLLRLAEQAHAKATGGAA